MTNAELIQLCEEAEQLVSELNNLSYSKTEEDSVIQDNLHRLQNIENRLSGEVSSATSPKTKKILQ